MSHLAPCACYSRQARIISSPARISTVEWFLDQAYQTGRRQSSGSHHPRRDTARYVIHPGRDQAIRDHLSHKRAGQACTGGWFNETLNSQYCQSSVLKHSLQQAYSEGHEPVCDARQPNTPALHRATSGISVVMSCRCNTCTPMR